MTAGIPQLHRALKALASLLALVVLALLALAPLPAQAEPADINAAARGVVRIVIIGRSDGEIYAVSHGTGFAVTPEQIVTNAHVVQEAQADSRLSIGVVPSDGGDAVYARLLAASSRNDLALLQTTAPMRLPPLTISGNPDIDSGPVTSVGYPMNVDRAQGLDMEDIFRAQPPVKATGFLSGRRPSREFDTLLHTAPIARGNSGGPLLDDCGRVVGVNSFGAESGGGDAEFYFAVSTRELLPFLRANDITPQINGLPCRSLADLNEQERERAERQQMAAEANARSQDIAQQRRQEDARIQAQFEILGERENAVGLAGLLMLVALGAGGVAFVAHERGHPRAISIGGGIVAFAVLGAGIAWLSRPGYDEIGDRAQDLLHREMEADEAAEEAALNGTLACVLDVSRSRVTGAAASDVPFGWDDTGCVNGRTQYGLSGGTWNRVLVPDDEESVSVTQFDPGSREYRVDRYLLGRDEMEQARSARGEYEAPACGSGIGAARELGSRQAAILSLLPAQPNERLVYECSKAAAGAGQE